MIKVIKRGSIEVRTCTYCGCKFSYEKEDVEEKCIDGYKAYREFVRCPQCDEEVILKQTKLGDRMQVVIDIPDWFKEEIDMGMHNDNMPLFLLYEIGHATPLPKGHGDLIDRDALRESMYGVCMGVMAGSDSYDAPLKTLDSATVVIEADKDGD